MSKSITSDLDLDDIKLLIEAVDDWEIFGSQEFHAMNFIKNVAIPSEFQDSEMGQALKQLKEHFRNREKDIMATRSLRQEKAIFVKAKLMLMRNSKSVDKLFEESQQPIEEEKDSSAKIPVADSKLDKAMEFLKETKIINQYNESSPCDGMKKNSLEDIEQYILECGMMKHYLEYLKEKNG